MDKIKNINCWSILLFSLIGCQTNVTHKVQPENNSPFVVIYTPDKSTVDSLTKEDENFGEAYSDCVYEENQVIKFLEQKKQEVIITNERHFKNKKVQIKFEKEPLYALALCVKDSVYLINEFSYQDFINEYQQLVGN